VKFQHPPQLVLVVAAVMETMTSVVEVSRSLETIVTAMMMLEVMMVTRWPVLRQHQVQVRAVELGLCTLVVALKQLDQILGEAIR